MAMVGDCREQRGENGEPESARASSERAISHQAAALSRCTQHRAVAGSGSGSASAQQRPAAGKAQQVVP